MRGNLNVGNDRARLIEVATQLLPIIGCPRTLNAINAINEIIPPTPSRSSREHAAKNLWRWR